VDQINPMQYQIKVKGRIDASWSDWFNGMQVSAGSGLDATTITILTGPVGDQAALRGILNHLWDLNLTILSVNLLEPQAEQV
jgi:hypothetical protein